MYISGMFMAAWTVLLIWGAANPLERKGLLMITASFLFLSVLAEFMFFGDVLGGGWFAFGVIKRVIIATVFTVFFFKQ